MLTKGLIYKSVALLIVVLCLYYFANAALRSYDSFQNTHLTRQLYLAVLSAFGLQIGVLLLDAWSWGWLLGKLGVQATILRAGEIFIISQFAKYLPGNIAQFVGRVVLARRAGWQTGLIALSIVMENGFALGSAGVMTIAGFMLWSGLPASGNSQFIIAATVLTLCWLAGTVLIRFILAKPPAFLVKRIGLDPPVHLNYRALFCYFGIHVASFVVTGGAFTLLLWGVGGGWPPEVWRVPAAVAIAWLAGYLVPGAPAGLGVREASLTAMLSPYMGSWVVISSVLLWRVTSLFADALLAAIAYGNSRRIIR
jgi:glycosyltransferase 2 family protein